MAFFRCSSGSGGGGNSKCDYLSAMPGNGQFDCGFKPKYIMLTAYYAQSNIVVSIIYDAEQSTTKYRQYVSGFNHNSEQTIGDSGSYGFAEVNGSTVPNGFVFNPSYANRFSEVWYLASE